MDKQEKNKRIRAGIIRSKKLPPCLDPHKRAMEIVEMRFEMKPQPTLEEISKKFLITRERVRQIINKCNGGRGSGRIYIEKIEKYCPVCGSTFITAYNQITCSRKCSNIIPHKRLFTPINGIDRCSKCGSIEGIYNWGKTFICRRCNTERVKIYRKGSEAKRVLSRIRIRQQEKFPEKFKARNIFQSALRNSLILKPEHCSKVGCYNKRIHGHHPDYSKPLEVIWLCPLHHTQLHKKLNEKE